MAGTEASHSQPKSPKPQAKKRKEQQNAHPKEVEKAEPAMTEERRDMMQIKKLEKAAIEKSPIENVPQLLLLCAVSIIN